MVFMPPGHSKSETCSKVFPAWLLGRNPDREVLLASYGADLAEDHSRIARATFNEWAPPLWSVNPSKDSKAVGRWGIAGHRGGMRAVGVRGATTGRRASVAIIDDPFKDWKEAASSTVREDVKNWYRSVLRTRLFPGGAIVLVQTRWHEDDLAGWLQQMQGEGGEQWIVLSLPALAEENDLIGRSPGAALWPEWFSREELLSIQGSQGGPESYFWNALYQQRPKPMEGLRFKRSWFRYFWTENIEGIDYHVLQQPDGSTRKFEARDCWRFQTVDPAATEKETSDYFVSGTWDVTPNSDLLLVDIFRERAETTKHKAVMRAQYDRYQPGFQAVERASYGLNIIQECILDGLPIQELTADRDKLSRSLAIQARYEVGAVYHRKGSPWLADYEDELIDFPNGAHDDQVDVASYAGIQVAGWGGEVAILTGKSKREAATGKSKRTAQEMPS